MLAALATVVLTCAAPTAVDGDTLYCANQTRSIRLWGIQAPELGQPGADAATRSLQALAEGGLACEQRGTSYGRAVAQCYNTRLFDVGYFQLREGHATEWCSFSRGFYGTCGSARE